MVVADLTYFTTLVMMMMIRVKSRKATCVIIMNKSFFGGLCSMPTFLCGLDNDHTFVIILHYSRD